MTLAQAAYDGILEARHYAPYGQRVSQTISGQVTGYLLDVQPGLWQVLASTTGADTTRFVHGPTGIQQQQNPNHAWAKYLVEFRPESKSASPNC